MTRTSWQKYLPPNCAPTPSRSVSSWTSCSIARSRNARPSAAPLVRQRVEIAGRGELHRLHRLLGAGPADDHGEVVGRAGRGAEGEDLLLEEGEHPVAAQDRRRRLIEEALVGRAAALGDEQELVGVLAFGGDLDLSRQVVAGVPFLEHRERRELAVAQVLLGVGVGDRLRRSPPRRRRRSTPAGPSWRRRSRCRCPGTSAARRRRRCWRSSTGRRRRTCRWRTPRGRRGSWRAGRDGRGA